MKHFIIKIRIYTIYTNVNFGNYYFSFLINLIVRYRIQQGSFDDFIIDPDNGLITIARKLDYDRRNNYRIEIVAADLGKCTIHTSIKFHNEQCEANIVSREIIY